MNGDNFKDWFANILPSLEHNSVIVMDNVPYHSILSKQNKSQPAIEKKNYILKWLLSKGEIFNRPMVKGQLFVRVEQIKDRFKGYVIYKIAYL